MERKDELFKELVVVMERIADEDNQLDYRSEHVLSIKEWRMLQEAKELCET